MWLKRKRTHEVLLYSLHSNKLEVTEGKVRERRPISPNHNRGKRRQIQRQTITSRCQFIPILAVLLAERAQNGVKHWEVSRRYLTLRQVKLSNPNLVLCNDIAICLEAICIGFLWINDRTMLENMTCIQLGITFALNIYLSPS